MVRKPARILRDDLTPSAAAAELGVDKSTVVRWLQEDRMAGWRTPGGHWHIPASEVRRLTRDADMAVSDAD